MRFLFLFLFLTSATFAENLEDEDNIEKVLESIFQKKENFSQDNFYEETLARAYHAYLEKDYKRAHNKLDLIFSKYKEKDWRYFAIRAKTHEALEQEDEAIQHYTFSIALNPAQPDIFKKLYELNFKIRRPVKSFDYLKLYLSQNEKDINLRYRALILAKRLGDEGYANYALNKIQSQNIYLEDQKKILENINSLITKKKYKQAKDESIKYLPYFPLEEELHNYLQIAVRNINPKGKEMESALIDTAVLFSDNAKYSLRLAMFYKEKKFYWKALDLFRRVFYTSLTKDGFALDSEILILLRECYFQLNFLNDVRACNSLIEIFTSKEKPEISEWNSLRINFSNNREFLVSLLYFAKSKDLKKEYEKFKELLNDRDEKKSDSERMNTYSIFVFDDFRNAHP